MRWEERAQRVVDEGGSGGAATMTMFALKNHSREDYRDRQEYEVSGKDGVPLMPAVSVVIGAAKAEPLVIEQAPKQLEGKRKRSRKASV